MVRFIPNFLLILFFLPSLVSAVQQDPADSEIYSQMLLHSLGQLFQNPTLSEELGIVDKQKQELATIFGEFGSEIAKFQTDNQELMKSIQRLSRTNPIQAKEQGEEYQAKLKELMNSNAEKIKDVLLPHQMDRLKQIAAQNQAVLYSEFRDEFGIAYSLAAKLGLTDAEKAALKDAIVAARKEYYAEVRKLKDKTHEKILNSLPAEKRDELKKLIGDRFDADDRSSIVEDKVREKK